MTDKQLTPAESDALEALVDRYGLATLTGALAVIAELKAEHVRTNWQDHNMARGLERCSTILTRAESAILREFSLHG